MGGSGAETGCGRVDREKTGAKEGCVEGPAEHGVVIMMGAEQRRADVHEGSRSTDREHTVIICIRGL